MTGLERFMDFMQRVVCHERLFRLRKIETIVDGATSGVQYDCVIELCDWCTGRCKTPIIALHSAIAGLLNYIEQDLKLAILSSDLNYASSITTLQIMSKIMGEAEQELRRCMSTPVN